jgi:hypothetical protein
VPADNGKVSGNLRGSFQSNITQDRGNVTSHLTRPFQNYPPVNGRDISGYLALDIYRTIDASKVAGLLVGRDPNIVPELRAVRIARSKC